MKNKILLLSLFLCLCPFAIAFADDKESQKNDSAPAAALEESSLAGARATAFEIVNEDIARATHLNEEAAVQARQVTDELQQVNAEHLKLTEQVASISTESQAAAPPNSELLLKAKLAYADLKKGYLEKKEAFLQERMDFQTILHLKLQDYLRTVFSENPSILLISAEIKSLRRVYTLRLMDQLSLKREMELISNRIAVETKYLSVKDALLATTEDSERAHMAETISLAEDRLRTFKDIRVLLDEKMDFLKSRINGNEEFDKLLRLRRNEVFFSGIRSKTPRPYGGNEILAFFLTLVFLTVCYAIRKRFGVLVRENPFVFRRGLFLCIFNILVFLGVISLAGYCGLNILGFRLAAQTLGLAYLNIGFGLAIFLILAFFAAWSSGVLLQWITRMSQVEIKNSSAVYSLANTVLQVFLFVFIAGEILSYWSIRREAVELLLAVLNYPILKASGLEISIRILVRSLLVIWIFFWLSRFINRVLETRVYPKTSLDGNSQHAIQSVIRFVSITAGLVLSVQLLGVNLSALAVFSGTLGLGIGLGLQDIIKNIVSGFVIYFERPIRIGDVVEVGNTPGQVKSIRTRSTIINTYDNISIVVPNSEFLSERVVNWSLSDRLVRMEAKVGVAYGSDVEAVKQTLLDIAKANENILKHPEPFVIFEDFADSALLFRVLFWVDVEDRMEVKSQVNFSIYSRFKERSIEIPFPQRDIHIKSSNVQLQK